VDAGNPPSLDDGEEPPTKPVFDENFFFFNWDEEHPEVHIPDEIRDDLDNDWRLTQERKEELLTQYAAEQAEAAAEAEKAKAPPAGSRR